MPVYEVKIDGKVYEVKADSMQAASQALASIKGVQENARPGTLRGSFNRGLAETAGMFVDPAAALYNAAATPFGAKPITFPGGRSANSIAAAGAKAGIDTKPAPGVLGRTAENFGAGLPFSMFGGPALQTMGRLGSDMLSSGGAAFGEFLGREATESEVGAGAGSILGGVAPQAVAGATRTLLRGGPERGRDMRARIDRFDQQGIEPSISQSTGSRAWGTIESGLGATVGGTSSARNFGIRQQNQSQNAIINAVRGGSLDKSTAGRMIREGVFGDEGYVALTGARTEANYKRVWSIADGTQPVALDSTKSLLADLPDPESLGDVFVKPAIRRIADIVNSGRPHTLAELDLARKHIGNMLGNPSLTDDISRRDLKRLYAAVSGDMEIALGQQGIDAIAAFKSAQKDFKKHMVYMDGIVNKLSKIDADEKVFQALEGGSAPDTAVLKQAKDVLDEGQWKYFVRTFTNRMGGIQPSQELPELTFSTEKFLTRYNNIRREAPEALDIIYGKGQFRNDIEKVVTTFEDIRRSKVYTNPSQSAGTGITAATIQAIPMVIGGGVIGGLTGVGTLAGSAVSLGAIGSAYGGTMAASNLMHNQKFVRWLARSTEISPAQYGAHIARLKSMGEGAENDFFNELADAITEGLNDGN